MRNRLPLIALLIFSYFAPADSAFPNIARDSQVLRHADSVLVVGFPQDWRLKTELRNCLGSENVDFVTKITVRDIGSAPVLKYPIPAVKREDTAKGIAGYDAILMYSGDYTYKQVKELSNGRQMIIHLPMYASICGNINITTEQKRGVCKLETEAYFTKGYKKGDEFELAWKNQARIEDYSKTTPIISTANGGVVVLEDKYPEGRIVAIDFDMLEGDVWSFPDYQDMVLQWVLEAAGRDNVDLGFYLGRWYDYEEFIGKVEAFAAAYSMVNIEDMPYIGNGSKTLKLVTISPEADRPVVFVETGIHPIEPTGCYGVYGYLCRLLEDYRNNDIWARTVLDNLEIQWVPVVCAGSFDKYFENPAQMPPFGNTNGDNVNLNRNFEPYNIWEAAVHPHKGTEPFSAPELKNIKWAVERSLSRMKVFADYHNTSLHYKGDNTYYGTFAHTVRGVQYNEYTQRTASAFSRRYYYRDFCDYELKEEYTSVSFDRSPHFEEAQPMSQVYGHYKGVPLSVLIEVWGIRDIHPYQQIGQFDAAATAFEQMLGFELGAVFFNHTSKAKSFKCGFSHLNPDENLKMYIIGKDRQVRQMKNITAADNVEVVLERSERLIILKQQYTLFTP